MAALMSAQAVVFDKDGLLIDSEKVSHRAWQLAMTQLDLTMTQEIYLSLLGRSGADVEVTLTTVYGASHSGAEIRAVHDAHFRHIETTEGIPVKPGALELLTSLRNHNIPMAVATSSEAPHAIDQMNACSILDFFGAVVTGNEIQNGKPNPDIYQEAAKRLDQPASLCLALEDSDPGVLAASRAGMRVIHVPDMATPAVEIESLAWQTCPSLLDAHPYVHQALALPPDG